MSPTLARRLGACAKTLTTTCHARTSTTSSKSQEAPPNFQKEHLDRLAWIQKDDISKLVAVRAKIKEYQVECGRARELLAGLPAALEPLESLSPVCSLEEHQKTFDVAMQSLNRLNDQKLSNLLAHVEDLLTELFPDPGRNESELAFMQQIGGMTAEEKQDKYNSLTMEIRAVAADAARKIAIDTSVPGAKEAASTVQDPFAAFQMDLILTGNSKKSEKGEQVKAGDNLKFGLSTEEQFASVLAGTTKSENSLEEKIKMSTANFGLGDDGEKTVTKDTSATMIEDAIEEKVRKELKKELKEEPTAKPVSFGITDDLHQIVSRDEASETPKPAARSSVVSRLARQAEDAVVQKPAVVNVQVPPATSSETPESKPVHFNIGAMQALLEASFKKAHDGSNKP